MAKKDVPRCGAKLRNGGTCKAPGIGAGGRCPRHGGANGKRSLESLAKRPEKSLARGFYTDVLFPWEEDIYASCKTGTLEEELKLLRVQLLRAVKAQHNYEVVMDHLGEFREDPESVDVPLELFRLLELDGYEYTQANKAEGVEEVKKMLRRKRDYRREIQQWVKLISTLEVAQKELLKSELFGQDTMEKLAGDLRDFTAMALATVAPPKDDGKRTS